MWSRSMTPRHSTIPDGWELPSALTGITDGDPRSRGRACGGVAWSRERPHPGRPRAADSIGMLPWVFLSAWHRTGRDRHAQFPVRHAHLAVRHAHLARSRPSEGTNSRDVFAERVEVCVSPRTPVRCSPTGVGRRVAMTRTAQPASRRTHYQAALAETVVRDDQLGLGRRSRMRARTRRPRSTCPGRTASSHRCCDRGPTTLRSLDDGLRGASTRGDGLPNAGRIPIRVIAT